MGVENFPSNSTLLMIWLYALAFTGVCALIVGLFGARLEKGRGPLFSVLIFPPLVVAIFYAIRDFGTLERPLVHWIFEKEAADSLRLGLVFDPLSFITAVTFGIAMMAICFRNRPSARMSSALAFSWLGLSLAATSQTLWLAALGMGIQVLARTFPLIESGQTPEADDVRWISSTKRAWIGLATVLTGAAGLAAQGVHLDFFSTTTWSSLETTPSALIAGGLLIAGLLLMATPALASHALIAPPEESVETHLFVNEAALAWIAVLIFYRLFPNIHESEWLLALGVGAGLATAGSLIALLFQTSKASAIYLWLSAYPVAILMLLPFLPAREGFLLLVGSLVAFNGLWVALDHRRSKSEIAAASVFFLGATGFVGWATSAGLTSFFARFESEPILCGGIFLLLLLYWSFGWRIVLRGGLREGNASPYAKWLVLGLFFVLGFGPLLSGRWGGGGIPGETDWIEGAKTWAWMKAGATETSDAEWLGFTITQGLVALSALFGIFAWRTADLFPFAAKYPRGARAAQGLFGILWLQAGAFRILKRMGEFGAREVSEKIWERLIPSTVGAVLTGFQKIGRATEHLVDGLTAGGYGRLLSPAAKLVQWFHGGNVRLYAWFALIWILIFSVYLTR